MPSTSVYALPIKPIPMRLHPSSLAIAASIVLGGMLAAQPQHASRFVLASITDDAGAPMGGAAAEDFIVRENGTTREVVGATAAHYPIAVLVDTSNFARPVFVQLRTAAVRFLGGLTGRDVALYTFGDVAMRAADFTRDVGALQKKAGGLFAEPQGQTHAADAIIRAASDLKKRNAAVSMIVVLSAGGVDRSGRMPAVVEETVLASRAIVYAVDMRPATVAAPANRPGGNGEAVDMSMVNFAGERLLRGLAERTMGRYQHIFSGSGFDEVLNALRQQVAAEVVLEYAVPPGSQATVLEIGTHLPGATARGVGLERQPQ
jgi:hypothetical protein